eukprot:TRINITY_DN2680_c0_g1_i1.p1 TRINITY_DN2680_c0_g1~~TRINITY_DN2680_c0_g1_i1.p1  ORF type:complete len:712 (+),score=119.45 TRINITY_DN2680_c0_g1_i1:29-2164(+)
MNKISVAASFRSFEMQTPTATTLGTSSPCLFSDVHLTVGRLKFNLHRIILAHSSNYFKKLFLSSRSSTSRKKKIDLLLDLDEYSSNYISDVLNFLYTGSIGISLDSVVYLTKLSKLLEIPELEDLLVNQFLPTEINKETAPALLKMAIHAGEDTVIDMCLSVMGRHFSHFRDKYDFQQLPVKILAQLLDHPSTFPESEKDIYETIVNYLTKFKDVTEEEKVELFSKVRFENLSYQFLDDVKNRFNKLIASSSSTTSIFPKIFPTLMQKKKSSITLPLLPSSSSSEILANSNYAHENSKATTAKEGEKNFYEGDYRFIEDDDEDEVDYQNIIGNKFNTPTSSSSVNSSEDADGSNDPIEREDELEGAQPNQDEEDDEIEVNKIQNEVLNDYVDENGPDESGVILIAEQSEENYIHEVEYHDYESGEYQVVDVSNNINVVFNGLHESVGHVNEDKDKAKKEAEKNQIQRELASRTQITITPSENEPDKKLEEDTEEQSEQSTTLSLSPQINNLLNFPRRGRRNSYGRIFEYEYDFDRKGILYFISTDGYRSSWKNPHKTEKVVVTGSSIEKGKLKYVVNLDARETWSCDVPSSWFTIDLGKNRSVKPNCYTLRHGSNSKQDCLRNWVLKASDDNIKWTTLMRHSNDRSLSGNWSTHSWLIENPQKPWRYFRILQTGHNSSNHNFLSLSGIELYGELYLKQKLDSRGHMSFPKF